MHIVANILSLVQHQKTLMELPERYRPERCACGKAGLWSHGHYDRKADRAWTVGKSLNPVAIPRFFCRACGKTCSVLPECLPPRRWYLWDVQQAALLQALMGKSLYAIAQELMPSRQTVKRWFVRFNAHFHLHKDVLCNLLSELGRTINFKDFWQTFLKNNFLSTGMRLCHATGVSVL